MLFIILFIIFYSRYQKRNGSEQDKFSKMNMRLHDKSSSEYFKLNSTDNIKDGLDYRILNDKNETLDRRIAFIFYHYQVLQLLENENIGLEIRKDIAERYLRNNSNSSYMASDISQGGLYKDWNDE